MKAFLIRTHDNMTVEELKELLPHCIVEDTELHGG